MRAVHCQHDDVTAEHGEGAVGEVDEPHQAHGDRKPNGDYEQHGAGGDSAQQDAGEITGKIHGSRKPSLLKRANGEWWRYAYSLLRDSSSLFLGSARADRLRFALVLHLIDLSDHLLMELAVRALHHLGKILVHDDVASLWIDHDRPLRTVELPAKQRLHGCAAVHSALGGLDGVNDGSHAVEGAARREVRR